MSAHPNIDKLVARDHWSPETEALLAVGADIAAQLARFVAAVELPTLDDNGEPTNTINIRRADA